MNELYCDRCGAASKVRYVFPNGQDLVFCGHHAREYEPQLPAHVTEDISFNQPADLLTV